MPNPLKLIIFRGLSTLLRVQYVSIIGDMGVFRGDPRDLAVITEYMLTGTYSPGLISEFKQFFDQHGLGTFIDVGANVGLTSVPLAKIGVECICFEPDPGNFASLAENARDVASLVTLHNLALFDQNEDVQFEISQWNHGDHRVRVGGGKSGAFGEQHRNVTTVRACRLDDLVAIDTVRRPLVVKIDTQGAEVHVVRGGSSLVGQADLLSLEFCPYLVRRMGAHEAELIDFVHAHYREGLISNWHHHDESGEWLPIEKLVGRLREFSEKTLTTQHLDLLLRR